jgi:hypothetical protein
VLIWAVGVVRFTAALVDVWDSIEATTITDRSIITTDGIGQRANMLVDAPTRITDRFPTLTDCASGTHHPVQCG